MALFVSSNLALQLLTLHNLSATLWLKKLLLVNLTVNWLTLHVPSLKMEASKSWHLITKMLFQSCVTQRLTCLPKLLVASSQTSTWVSVQLSKMVSTTILTMKLVKFLTKTFLVSKKKWRKSLKKTSHQSVKKWLKTKRVKSSKMTHINWNWLKNIQKMKVVWLSTVKVNTLTFAVAHTCHQLVVSKSSTFWMLQVLTGVEIAIMLWCNVFMVQLGSIKKTLKLTLNVLKKLKNVTTVNLVKNLICSWFLKRLVKVFHSGCQTVRQSVVSWNATSWTRK